MATRKLNITMVAWIICLLDCSSLLDAETELGTLKALLQLGLLCGITI